MQQVHIPNLATAVDGKPGKDTGVHINAKLRPVSVEPPEPESDKK